MLYAYSDDGSKILATPRARAVCPECGRVVIARCGEINVWHWGHEKRGDCDVWGEHETAWHLGWKRYFSPEYVEVSVRKGGVSHRADIRTSEGVVIELQHSPLSPDEIAEREEFYGRMVWVFDVEEPFEEERLEFRSKGDYYTFRWKMPRKHMAYTTRPALWDIGTLNLFRKQKMYTEAPCGGWGTFVSLFDFLRQHGGAYT